VIENLLVWVGSVIVNEDGRLGCGSKEITFLVSQFTAKNCPIQCLFRYQGSGVSVEGQGNEISWSGRFHVAEKISVSVASGSAAR
jgi:hypothetical protein